MSYGWLFLVAFVIVVVTLRLRRTEKPVFLKILGVGDWVEVMNEGASKEVAIGQRIAKLPSGDFGDGAFVMNGAVNLDAWPQQFRDDISRLQPIIINENWALAKIIVAAGGDETLVLGPLEDASLVGILRVAIRENREKISLRLQVCSQAIQVADNPEAIKQFDDEWQRYAMNNPTNISSSPPMPTSR